MLNLQTGNEKLQRNILESAHMTHIIGRQRILVPGHIGDNCFSARTTTWSQNCQQERSRSKGLIESPRGITPRHFWQPSVIERNQNLLIKHMLLNFVHLAAKVRTLCKVDHSHLMQLFLVSRSIHQDKYNCSYRTSDLCIVCVYICGHLLNGFFSFMGFKTLVAKDLHFSFSQQWKR